MIRTAVLSASLMWATATWGAIQQHNLPMTCGQLMPESGPFLEYFEAVGTGNAATNRSLATSVFKILAFREKLASILGRNASDNPVDILIRKTLCFYRIEKEPLRPVTFDDRDFVIFLKSSVKELEKKVEVVVKDAEVERLRRQAYERRLDKNHSLVETLRRKAEVEADREFDRLARQAKKQMAQ